MSYSHLILLNKLNYILELHNVILPNKLKKKLQSTVDSSTNFLSY